MSNVLNLLILFLDKITMRNSFEFTVDDPNDFEKKIIFFSKRYSYYCLLNSNSSEYNAPTKYYQYDMICGIDSIKNFSSNKGSLEKLRAFHKKEKDWVFGFLSYDLMNEIFKIRSENIDIFKNHNISFFIPRHVFLLKGKKLIIQSIDAKSDVNKLFQNIKKFSIDDELIPKFKFSARQKKLSYLKMIKLIKSHIQRGDIYEMNFCQEFYKENIKLPIQKLFYDLNELTKSPFATFLKLDNFNVIGTSPERYLLKNKNTIISQPIKGTSKRSKNTKKDAYLAKELLKSEKDISENIMIVDLVRNDLSVTALKGSVKVDDLCGVYTFSHVHQMISTISSKLDSKNDFIDILASTFPMGSMTGAPKAKAMELIEKYEETKRGVFSGSVGYVMPNGDFDFNVIIRSLLYDSKQKYLSFSVGGAIVSKSDPKSEYEECLIKAKPIFEIFS